MTQLKKFICMLSLICPFTVYAQTVVQSASASNNAADANPTLSVSFTSAPTPGNSVIVIWSSREPVGLSGIADNQSGNRYSSVVVETSSANGVDSEIWWEPAVVGSSGTFTVTGTLPSAEPAVITIMEVSGLSGAIDKTKAQGALNTSTTLTVTSSSANANANDLVVANIASGDVNTATGTSNPASTGYTSLNFIDGTNAYNGVVQSSAKSVSAVETSSSTWTAATAFNGAAATLATFKGATAPTAPSKFPFFGVGL